MIKFLKRLNCPSCYSSKRSKVFKTSFSESRISHFLKTYYKFDSLPDLDAEYEIDKCLSCGLLWQVQVLDDEGMTLLYDEWISATESKRKRESYTSYYFRNLSLEMYFNISILDKSRPSELCFLDFGMGWGEWAKMAKGYGVNTYAAELSEDRKSFARSLGLSVFQFGDSHQFDFINLDQVLEHLPNPREVVLKLKNQLNSRGIIKIAVPDGQNTEEKFLSPNWKPDKDALHPLEHINCYSPDSLKEFMATCGLKPLPFKGMIKLKGNSPIYLAKKVVKQLTSTTVYFVKSES